MTERTHDKHSKGSTPRTDAIITGGTIGQLALLEHACQLERELAWASAEKAKLTEIVAVRPSLDAMNERVAQLTAHRACGNQEQDADNGKLAGYCVVCQVPWPCAIAAVLSPIAALNHDTNPDKVSGKTSPVQTTDIKLEIINLLGKSIGTVKKSIGLTVDIRKLRLMLEL